MRKDLHKDWLAGEEPFSLVDGAATRELLENDDFLAAVSAVMRLLGCCFLYAPGEVPADEALAALRTMNIAVDWPFAADAAAPAAGDGADAGQDGPGGQAEAVLIEGLFARGAREEDAPTLREAFGVLFRGPGHLAAPPWGSVYTDRDQVMFGRTWLYLRQWLREHGIAATYEQRDPEDQFGRMLLLAGQLADERPCLLPEFLGNHLLCWSSCYLAAFAKAARAVPSATYEACGRLAVSTLGSLGDLLGIRPAKRRIYRREG